MNQQIDNALGGYDECASNPAKLAPDIKDYKFEANKYPSINWDVAAGEREGEIVSKPDTLLDQIKELRPKVTQGEWRTQRYKHHQEIVADDFDVVSATASMALRNPYDAQFIALAPQMADLCLSQAARIEEFKAELEWRKDRERIALGMAKQALENKS